MYDLTRRIVCLAMTGTLAIAGLAGCSGQAGQTALTKEPSSAAELAEMNEKTPGAKNYHFEGDFEISLNIMGQAIPVKASVEGDTADGNSHLTMTTEFMEEKQENEMYFVKEGNSYVQYSSSKAGDSASKTADETQQWSKMGIDANPIDSLSSKGLLSEGEFSKDGDAYTITLTGEQVLKGIASADKDFENALNEALKDSSAADLQSALKNSKLVFTFDKAMNNTAESLNFDYGTKSEVAGQKVEMNIKLGANMKLTNHGKVDSSKVSVPENVKSGAVDATAGLDELLKQLGSLGGTTQPAA